MQQQKGNTARPEGLGTYTKLSCWITLASPLAEVCLHVNLTGSSGAAEVRMDVPSHHPAVVLMAVSGCLLHPAAAAPLSCCFIIGALSLLS